MDLLLGVVRGADGTPVAGARVEATSVALQTSCLATTGPDGNYSIRFLDGGVQYRITVRAPSMMAAAQIISRQADEDRLQVNFTMNTLVSDTIVVRSNLSPSAGAVTSPHCG
jgi:hypothetical protein